MRSFTFFEPVKPTIKSLTLENVDDFKKAAAPFVPNGWNKFSKWLDTWGLGLFLIAISVLGLGPWVFRIWLDLEANLAANTAAAMFLGFTINYIIAGKLTEKFKKRPSVWQTVSALDFLMAQPSLVTSEFMRMLELARDNPDYFSYAQVEYTNDSPVVILWRVAFMWKDQETRAQFRPVIDKKIPMLVYDMRAGKVLVWNDLVKPHGTVLVG